MTEDLRSLIKNLSETDKKLINQLFAGLFVEPLGAWTFYGDTYEGSWLMCDLIILYQITQMHIRREYSNRIRDMLWYSPILAVIEADEHK